MSHANARLTHHGRCLLVRRVVFDGRPVAHVAAELGVSRQCAHRRVGRFRDQGWDGLADRRSGPRACPSRTPPEAEERVVAARRELRAASRTRSDCPGHRGAGPHRHPHPAPPPRPRARGLRPAHRAADPRDPHEPAPLRTSRGGRDGPPGRQETRPHPRRRRLAHARPQRSRARPGNRLRPRPYRHRRPLPAGLCRGPARREGHQRRLPSPGRPSTSPPAASLASSGC